MLPANPLTKDPVDLWDLQVSLTMIGGNVVFCRDGQEAICPP